MPNSGNYRGDNNDTKILGSDGVTEIGNVGDRLKVDVGANQTTPLPVDLSLARDMTNRLKVANTNSIVDSTWQYSKLKRLWSEVLTGSASIIVPGQKDPSYLKFQTTTASGDKIVFGTRRYLKYRPFRSHEISMAEILGPGDANTVQRFGQFTNFNGWFFERQGSSFYVKIRNNTNEVTGTNTVSVERASWNVDKFDGTGPSGLDLASNADLTGADGSFKNALTFIIEYVWHGTQGIKFGIQYFDQIYWGHYYKVSGTEDIPFSRTALLPLRYEMENVGAPSTAQTWFVGPNSFNIENGEEALGFRYTANRGTSGISVTSNTTYTNLLAIRPKATINGSNNRGFLVPLSFNIKSTDDLLVEIWLQGVATASDWASVGTESIAEYARTISAVTGGEPIQSFYISGGGNSNAAITATVEENVFSSLDALDNNTPLAIIIRAKKLGGNATAFAAIDWREVY